MLDFIHMLSDNINKATVKGDGVSIAIFVNNLYHLITVWMEIDDFVLKKVAVCYSSFMSPCFCCNHVAMKKTSAGCKSKLYRMEKMSHLPILALVAKQSNSETVFHLFIVQQYEVFFQPGLQERNSKRWHFNNYTSESINMKVNLSTSSPKKIA